MINTNYFEDIKYNKFILFIKLYAFEIRIYFLSIIKIILKLILSIKIDLKKPITFLILLNQNIN